MRAFMRNHLDDVLILMGAVLIVYATWVLSWIAALYVAGVEMILLGVLIGIGMRPAAVKQSGAAPLEERRE